MSVEIDKHAASLEARLRHQPTKRRPAVVVVGLDPGNPREASLTIAKQPTVRFHSVYLHATYLLKQWRGRAAVGATLNDTIETQDLSEFAKDLASKLLAVKRPTKLFFESQDASNTRSHRRDGYGSNGVGTVGVPLEETSEAKV